MRLSQGRAPPTTRKRKRGGIAILPRVAGENVEVVRRALVALSAGPDEILASAAEFWDDDADYYPARKFPEAQPCHGLEEIKQFLARFRETWSEHEWVVQELNEVGNDRVLASSTFRARRSGEWDDARGGPLPVLLVATRSPSSR